MEQQCLTAILKQPALVHTWRMPFLQGQTAGSRHEASARQQLCRAKYEQEGRPAHHTRAAPGKSRERLCARHTSRQGSLRVRGQRQLAAVQTRTNPAVLLPPPLQHPCPHCGSGGAPGMGGAPPGMGGAKAAAAPGMPAPGMGRPPGGSATPPGTAGRAGAPPAPPSAVLLARS